MKGFICDVIDMLRGDWFEKICGLSMIGCVSFVLILTGWGVFTAADSWGVDDNPGVAEVRGLHYHPAWTQVVVHSTGKSAWTQIIHHPESWTATLKIGDLSDNIGVTQQTYESFEMGQQVGIRYREGRMSRGLYVTEITPLEK